MAKQFDPRFFPSPPSQAWLANQFRLPEFKRLMAVLINFKSTLWGEKADKAKTEQPPPIDIELLINMCLSSGINESMGGLDTAVLRAATVVRQQYWPPVLGKLPDSLKSAGLELMRSVDLWMADGMRVLFNNQSMALNQAPLISWLSRWDSLAVELDRLWMAAGGGPILQSAPKSDGSVAREIKSEHKWWHVWYWYLQFWRYVVGHNIWSQVVAQIFAWLIIVGLIAWCTRHKIVGLMSP